MAISSTTWVPNLAGIAAYEASDPGLYAALTAAIAPAVAYARAIAPVGDPDTDPHSGDYRNSIRSERNPNGPGMRLLSDDPKAHWIEYGAAHMRRHRVLGQAMDRINR